VRVRVRPYEFDRYATSKRWAVEIFDQHERNGGEWVVNSNHRFFRVANFKAWRLSKFSLAVKENVKDKFVRRLKDGDEDE
jgi:hypothetical protein